MPSTPWPVESQLNEAPAAATPFPVNGWKRAAKKIQMATALKDAKGPGDKSDTARFDCPV